MRNSTWEAFLVVICALAICAGPSRAQETKKETPPEAKQAGKAQGPTEGKKEEAGKETKSEGKKETPTEGGEAPKYSLSLEPTLRWVNVSGDEEKFREHWWITDRWAGGGDFSFTSQIRKDLKLDMPMELVVVRLPGNKVFFRFKAKRKR